MMRQDVDLASEGSIRTLKFLELSPPPNHPFDYALPAPAEPAVHQAFGNSTRHNNDYWQMGGLTP